MNPKLPSGILLGLLLLAVAAPAADTPPVIPIWPGVAPGSAGQSGEEMVRITGKEQDHVLSGIHQPALLAYLPPAGQATGAAVVVIPGGGHRELWMDHEGYNVGRWLAAHGIAGFVVKYRLAREKGSTYRVEVESLADVQRAIRLVRSRAAEWNVDPARVGVLGFSAGGELAALAGLRFTGGAPNAADPVDRLDDKPAFQALIYPGNTGSIKPGKESPPAFLLSGYGDSEGMVGGLVQAFARFKEAGVPAELHIYTGVGHGFGLRGSKHTPSAEWPERFRAWLGERGFLGRAP